LEEGPFPSSYDSSKSWPGPSVQLLRLLFLFFVDVKAAGAKDMQTEMSIAALSVVAESNLAVWDQRRATTGSGSGGYAYGFIT